jgi:hypothetical protein
MGILKSEGAKSLLLERKMVMTNNMKIWGRFGVVGDI